MREVGQVFGIGVGETTPAYVDRGSLDEAFQRGLSSNRHVSVHGGSKQGKTWLRKRGLSEEDSIVVQVTITSTAESLLQEALEQIGVTATLSRTSQGTLKGSVDASASLSASASWFVARGEATGALAAMGGIENTTTTTEGFLAQGVANLKWVSQAILQSNRRLVIEDFHYLPENEQRTFASWLKALGEYGCFVVVIGVWPQSHLLTYFNGDLEGRVDDIHLKWDSKDLEAVLVRGTHALDVVFSPEIIESLVTDSYGNVGLIHRLAYSLCLEAAAESGGGNVINEQVKLDRASVACW